MTAAPLIPAPDLNLTGEAALVVALSGGLDSMVLLHALASMPEARKRGLRAVHIHHGLYGDADAWANHCEETCAALHVPLRSVRVEVARDGGEGLEAAARRARHAALAAELGDDEVLALAHHRDDQAETFLLRALRSSGIDGLGAMRRWRRFDPGWLWRPLLDRSRTELLAYAQAHGLRWIDDPSNADVAFDRNFLRQRVLPLLRERWPQAEAAFARSAELCAEATDLLGSDDARALAQVRTADTHTLSRTALRALAPARRARVLRMWVNEFGLPPLPAEGIARIEAEVLNARDDAGPQFGWHGATVHAWRDLLHADWQHEALPADWNREWDGKTPLVLPDGSQLRLTCVTGFEQAFVVHARRGGERIVLPGRSHSHTLKHVLQDLGVPPWTREGLPLLSDAKGALHAVGDMAYSETFELWLREHHARLLWNRAPHQ
ncbi:MAG TPA: tRNA lysidine(34) synthetase TilS [Lysobacter sp.]|jgi:tRNA(Ile)-lysidine synthase|nr:tRNA lysidine(34) synthetase TilS [Lysobacter sp.]